MHNATTTDQLFRRCRDPLSCAWRLAAATAYYLAKNHGITNVAVLEAGWIGGGNTGRNTTIVRSNCPYPGHTPPLGERLSEPAGRKSSLRHPQKRSPSGRIGALLMRQFQAGSLAVPRRDAGLTRLK
jgi:glycine/D-amino acid oxidase-like deaminating enzyme